LPRRRTCAEGGSWVGTCSAIDWASRETTRPRTGSLCPRLAIKSAIICTSGLTECLGSIIILRLLDPQASPPDAVLAVGARILKYRVRLACPSIAPVDRLAGLRVLAAPPIDAAASEAIEIRSRRLIAPISYSTDSQGGQFTVGSHSVQIVVHTRDSDPKIALMAMVSLELRFSLWLTL
jgi:hypothetical protein